MGSFPEKVTFFFAAEICNTFCGTPQYMAPEILLHKKYDFSVDWWALGVTMYDMTTGSPPFSGSDEDALFDSILHTQPNYNMLSPKMMSLIEGFLMKSPKDRLGCGKDGKAAIKRHNSFKGCDWDRVV